MTVKIFTAFDTPPKVSYVEDMPSLTQQHFADHCDINKIMERYRRTGMMPVTNRQAIYGDFTDQVDFLTAQNQIAQAKEAFASLPARLRQRFNNNPAELLGFLEDPTNREEAERLGLVEKKAGAGGTVVPPAIAQEDKGVPEKTGEKT